MNDEYLNPDSKHLEPPLEAAVQSIRAQPLSEAAIERVKTRAKLLAIPSTATPLTAGILQRRWATSRKVLAGLGAVAALLLVGAGVTLLLDRSGSQAFAQVLENVKALRTVRFTTSTQFGLSRKIEGQMYLEGNRMRLEQFDGKLIQIGDLDKKQALFLDGHRKLAESVEIDAKMVQEFANPIDKLRQAQANDAERIGQEILRGRRTQVYRLRKVDLLGIKGSGEMQVWVDAESHLPAKIVIRDPDPKAEMEMRFDEFIWNEPLDPKLFSLDLPEGFQKGSVVSKSPLPEPLPNGKTLDSPNVQVDGILSRDRVPAQLIWNRQGTSITALMRDPESVPPPERRPNELRQWDIATGKLRWSQSIAGAGSVAGSSDGKFLATIIGREIQLRDTATGQVTRKWTTDKPLSPLAFSPDGKFLAAGITEWGPFGGNGGKPSGGVQFWEIERGSLIRTIAEDKPTTFVKYSLEGKSLATSSNEGPVKLWDVNTGELMRLFPGCHSADFSPDGTMIACPSALASADKTVGKVDLYKLQDGSLVKSLVSEKAAATSFLESVPFSPDGHWLAAADWNGTVSLWNVASGQRKQTSVRPSAGVLSAAFTPEGGTLATGGEDKILHLWKLSAQKIEPVSPK